MPLEMGRIFEKEAPDNINTVKKKRRRVIPSLKVIVGIIGVCWESPSTNGEIARSLGVTDSVISEAIKGRLFDSNLLLKAQSQLSKKSYYYTINFSGIIDYITDHFKVKLTGDKETLKEILLRNREIVADRLLWFVTDSTYEKSLRKVRHVYETIPELLLLLILSLDPNVEKNNVEYCQFLREFHRGIFEKYEEESPLIHVWSGFLWQIYRPVISG
jgi:DNA-binding transcriptional regulator GbsR (MarR family)